MTKKISVTGTHAGGKRFCCIREMYKDGDEWKPSNKGISIDETYVAEVKAAVEEALEIDPFPESQTLRNFERNQSNHLIVEIKKFKGKEMLDIRQYYKDKEDSSKFNPSKKGITFPPDILDDVVLGLSKFMENFV